MCRAARDYFISYLGPQAGDTLYQAGMKIPDQIRRVEFFNAVVSDLEAKRNGASSDDLRSVKLLDNNRFPVVPIREFIEDEYFLNMKGVMWPKILDCMEEMNNGEYQEAVLTGAIGVGKTAIAVVSTAYQLYLLACYRSPHLLFGLDPSSEIVMVFQSINANLAKSVDFARFKSILEKSIFFREHFPFDKGVMSELKFPNRVIVKPVSGQDTAAIGQNVIGGVIDEMNFMAVVTNSKASVDGGTYNQAMALYNSISRRRKSRFMSQGKLPGLLCLVSSKRYPGQFTDTKEEEARKELELTGKTSIYVYDKRLWDVKPPGAFNGRTFKLFLGDGNRKPRILADNEDVTGMPDRLIMDIPEEYRVEFEVDLMNAIRDIAGMSTLATHPFIVEREAITRNVRATNIILGQEEVDFVATNLDINPDEFYRPELPRFAHIDLALSGDAAGLCIGTMDKFVTTKTTNGTEIMPHIWIDALLAVKPPKGGEIQFSNIREILYALRKLGLNIRWVTFDTYQSVDSIQILRKEGFLVGTKSVDTDMNPYEFVKNALYTNRLSLPNHSKAVIELASLEKDTKKNKVDHPPNGSKDVADALAGVVYGVTMRREFWAMHGVPLVQVPEALKAVKENQSIK